jgi:DNA-directed RNA polymerase omega subunit
MENVMTETIDKAYSKERTAGLTSQEAVAAVGNRYDLVLIASQRVRELRDGAVPRVQSRHGAILTALKEIEQGHIGRNYLYKTDDIEQRRRDKR